MKKYTSFAKTTQNKMIFTTSHRNKEGVFEMPGIGYIVRIKVKIYKNVTTYTTISKHITKEEAELKYASLIAEQDNI